MLFSFFVPLSPFDFRAPSGKNFKKNCQTSTSDLRLKQSLIQRESIFEKRVSALRHKSLLSKKKLEDFAKHCQSKQKKCAESIHQKLVQAQSRRAVYKKFSRSKWLDISKVLDESVCKLQITWIQKRTVLVQESLKATGLVELLGTNCTYDAFTSFMTKDEVVEKVDKFIENFDFYHTLPDHVGYRKTRAKAFLSCILIAQFGDEIFDADKCPAEQGIITTSRGLRCAILDLQCITDEFETCRRQLRILAQIWSINFRMLGIWKQKSKNDMNSRIQAELSNLDSIIESVSAERMVIQEWTPHVRMLKRQLCGFLSDINSENHLAHYDSGYSNNSERESQPEMSRITNEIGALSLPICPSKPSNIQIIHDLYLETNFDYAKLYLCSQETIEAKFKKQFDLTSNSLSDDLFVRFVGECRRQLIDIAEAVRKSPEKRKYIEDGLDTEILEQQIANKTAIDYDSIFHFILDRMSEMCAPVRDDAIELLRASDLPLADRLAAIFEILATVNMDIMNYLLKQVKAKMTLSFIIEYEKRWFQSFEPHKDPRLIQLLASIDCSKNDKTILEIFIAVISASDKSAILELPLIFQLDERRVKRCRLIISQCTIFASVVLHMRNNGKNCDSKRLKAIIDSHSTDQSCMAQSIYAELNGEKTTILSFGHIEQIIQGVDSVSKLLRSRIERFLRDQIVSSKGAENAWPEDNGLESVREELLCLVVELQRFYEFHRQIHEQTYNRLLKDVIQLKAANP